VCGSCIIDFPAIYASQICVFEMCCDVCVCVCEREKESFNLLVCVCPCV
jgi:hypothetical protein